MKHLSTHFLRLVILAMAAVTLLFGIFLVPNAIRFAASDYSMTVAVSAAVGIYAAAVPFFLALFQGLRLLGYIDKNKAFSTASARALGIIKFAAVAVSLFAALTLPLLYATAEDEDAPGLILIGLSFIGMPFVVGVFAAVMQKLLASAVRMKSENDLTV